jgi:hypothetical protein
MPSRGKKIQKNEILTDDEIKKVQLYRKFVASRVQKVERIFYSSSSRFSTSTDTFEGRPARF